MYSIQAFLYFIFYIVHTVIFSLILVIPKFVVFNLNSSSPNCSRSVDKKLHLSVTKFVFPVSTGGPDLQPSLYTAHCTVLSITFFKTLASMYFCIATFHFFFSLPLFEPLTTKFFTFTGALSSSIFFMCPNHRNLCSFKNSTNHYTVEFA